MSSMERLLFVGGPKHGEVRSVSPGFQTWRVVVIGKPLLAGGTHVYHRLTTDFGMGVVTVMRSESVTVPQRLSPDWLIFKTMVIQALAKAAGVGDSFRVPEGFPL